MSAAKTCPYCGQIHREGARFCNATGRLLEPDQPASQSPGSLSGQTGKLQPKTILNNRYVVIDKIGQGGMAAVYKATDTWQPGSFWAVKEMSDKALIDPEEREWGLNAFRQEAELLRTLSHPNLPKVIDYFTHGSKHYLIMELINGETLESMLKTRSSPFTEAEVLTWSLQLCNVLSYLHSQRPQIIFRDLKPGNIMLSIDGQIKLIDFGIVRFFKPGKSQDTMALGTPGYTAPEAVSGQTDERSDIYSLCVTMHQLLTNHNPVSSLFNIPPARTINPAVTTQMETILKRGTEANRMYRWSNTYELHQALQTLSAFPAVPGYPPENLQQEAISPFGTPAMAGAFEVQRQKQVNVQKPPVEYTSRPTTRLIAAASQLSIWQLALIGGITIVTLAVLTALLAEPLDNLNFNWNNVPIIALFGAFGYAAYPKRGSVFISHVLLTTVMVLTINLVLGYQNYSMLEYTIAVLTSGAVMEIWAAFLPRIKGPAVSDTWMREVAWLAVMEIIGITIFFTIVAGWESGIAPLMWGFSALFGGLGWFLGDLIQQLMVRRKSM